LFFQYLFVKNNYPSLSYPISLTTLPLKDRSGLSRPFAGIATQPQTARDEDGFFFDRVILIEGIFLLLSR